MKPDFRRLILMPLLIVLSLPCYALFGTDDSADYAQTRYPIVLAHGMAGFDDVGPYDYWFGIIDDLREHGATVYLTQVSSFHSSEVRGEQLLKQVEEILAISGAQKVNLVGHSHGSHSARYVAAMIPDRVASVTAVGGPTKGSPVADFVYEASKYNETLSSTTTAIVDAFGALIGLAAGEELPQDSREGLYSLTTEGAADFNARFPAGVPQTACGEGDYVVNDTRYYSWSGVGLLTTLLDPSDEMLLMSSAAFIGTDDSDNDGLVGRCSSHLGQVIRDDYFMNHLDEVNQISGLRSLLETDPVVVFRQHANRLKNAGL